MARDPVWLLHRLPPGKEFPQKNQQQQQHIKKLFDKPDVVVHVFNTSPREAETAFRKEFDFHELQHPVRVCVNFAFAQPAAQD
ncbi:hypothetical protein H671_4g11919 [Cricetulus griseus]|uniref:Uncharacterized protein n=1 Tax=Cricetulus griseus TaxID=10029 RepID=A0A061I8P3_CRIGR|nr:hypothetical protein H671_4g11919 [Cricetulus griseus]